MTTNLYDWASERNLLRSREINFVLFSLFLQPTEVIGTHPSSIGQGDSFKKMDMPIYQWRGGRMDLTMMAIHGDHWVVSIDCVRPVVGYFFGMDYSIRAAYAGESLWQDALKDFPQKYLFQPYSKKNNRRFTFIFSSEREVMVFFYLMNYYLEPRHAKESRVLGRMSRK